MKKLLRRLVSSLWLVCVGVTPLCFVEKAFADDNIAEIEAALAREAQAGPRLKAASPKLLSATDGSDTYEATGELNVTKRSGSIVLKFNVPKEYILVNSIVLSVNAFDVDYPVHNERDLVYFNNVCLGRLQGENTTWVENTFRFMPSTVPLRIGENTLRIDVNVVEANEHDGGWWTRIGWAKLVVDGVVDYIRLEASSNLDDSIKLSWEVPSGKSGVRYYIDRRGSPNEQFKCLNKDNPTPDRFYYDNDRDCLPGVNYYYRVRSESGIESNEVVGKRVAKTVEPKFQFTLTGTDRPSNIKYRNRNGIVYGAKGINGEDDVLVAGHAFWCEVALTDIVPSDIKYIRLVGYPAGGAASQKRHNIICFNGNDSSFFDTLVYLDRDWMFGKVVPSEGNTFKFAATLRAGNGYHGKYDWSIVCEYEINGKVGYETIAGVSKPVYFEKYGTDNGMSVNIFSEECWKRVPNWFTYWKEDGACPSLKDNEYEVHYRGTKKAGSLSGGEANSDVSYDSQRKVYLNYDAAYIWGPSYTAKPTTINNKTFFTWNGQEGGREVFGIYMVEDIVAHETQHHKTAIRYNLQKGTKKDSDKQEGKCIFQSATNPNGTVIAECKILKPTHKICDSIVDEDEVNDFFGLKKFFGTSFNGTSANAPDTYKLEKKKMWEYGAYGDNELVSMVAGRLGVRNGAAGPSGMERANRDKDWAYPGELAGGIPPEASPSYSGTRRLSATPKTSSKLQSSEPQPSTNLVITINSIAVNTQQDQNSVTGIVYTIGVSIQGDDLVDFNGYLVDAQSNVVATAVSAANAESESVELFFDSRNIFDNYNGGPLTLGRVDLTVDGNYSTNNAIGTLYDFAVEPIEVNKSELLCNKGYILDGATTNDVSASGIAVSIPVLVNVADDYRLEAELVSTNDELVATAFAMNYCATGTNVFALTFSSDAIYQNGRSGIHAVKNVRLWCGDEMIDANAVALELTESRDIADFVPSGVSVVVDSSSGRFLEPAATPDGKLSSVRFVFDVTNATDTMVGYDVASVLMNTNSEIVASIRTTVAVTNGLNQIEITIPASTIAKSGVDGPYRFESIELLPQGESSCGTTYRPSVLSAAYTASDFGASAIEACGTPRLVDTPDRDRLTVEYSYEALRVGRVIEEVVLADRNGDFAARVAITNDVAEVGVKTNRISIASGDVFGGVTNSPYAVACLSLAPDIIGESPVYMDTGSLTNIFWQVASPVFAPATKTVFFRQGQPVVMSCATDGAEIRYTLDGSEPTEISALYDGSLTISSNTTVKAKAFVEGMRPSEMVQAEYIRAAIVGDNLVQNTSPKAEVSQVVSVPVPGTYQVTFDYTQGGDIELRLSQGGTVRTLATVSAVSGGTTNFLFDVSAAGDYELTVYDLSSGTVQPAQVSNLSMSIPNTPENNGRYWIYETENTFGSTGEWITEHGFQNGKLPVDGTSTFMPYTQSDGRFVTIVSTLESNSYYEEDPDFDCKAAITCVAEDKALVFKVITMENGVRVWKTVGAEGLAEPALHTPYTVKLTLDCTNRTYTAAIIGEGAVEFTLTHGTTNEFAFAGQQNTAVGQVDFEGTGNVMSLLGDYKNSSAEFMRGDVLQLVGGQSSQALTEGQAAWLNSMKGYYAVKAKVATMGLADFNDAYLLNLDISQSEFGLGMFKVTGIEVTEDEVRISVTLNREGAIQVSSGGTSRDAPINGLLKLYGGETPSDRTLLNATVITDDSFSSGDTEVFTYPRSGPARFFCPAIVSP